LNELNYRQLSEFEARSKRNNTTARLKLILTKQAQPYATLAEQTFFKRSFLAPARQPMFYILPKVHKETLKTRPVVSCSQSPLEIGSRWLDSKLQQVIHLCPAYTRDSQQLLLDIKSLGTLPVNSRLSTSDAISMYTNIHTEHGIDTIAKWLDLHRSDLPKNFPPNSILVNVLKEVMTNNVFCLDDTYWHQISGTAMGTSVACAYATIYYSYWEETTLLPKYRKYIFFYRRFIDDIFLVWNAPPSQPDTLWENFKTDMDAFGDLRWTPEPLTTSVTFLDLSIVLTINRQIKTKTFQKDLNLYLYIPAHSAHPPGCLKGIIFGELRRYWNQNSDTKDYIHIAGQFYKRLLARGFRSKQINPLFLEAAANLERASVKNTENSEDLTRPLCFHWIHHPNDISRKAIQQAYSDTCAVTLKATPTKDNRPLNITKMIVLYSRPKNLSDYLCRTVLKEQPGNRVSDHIKRLGPAP